MNQRDLEVLLQPKPIAVIGVSMKPQHAGYLTMRNLLADVFNGPILPVTPARKAMLGMLAWPAVESLPFTPDLAVLCTSAQRNIELLEALEQKGYRTCIILSSQPERYPTLLERATHYQMRLLGPNSLGLLAPWQGLDASFSPVTIHRGKLAFISQSTTVSNTILDWTQQREMGFSYFIALDDSLDIDVGGLLDFLAHDGKTSAILFYLEHLNNAYRSVSAVRSASRNRPILVIKNGRNPVAQKLLHVNSGMDPAQDAAVQRTDLLQVQDTHELFFAVETSSHMRPLRGEKLMIVSNGTAPAALALNELWLRNGELAVLSERIHDALRQVLPIGIKIAGPLGLQDDTSSEHHQQTVNVLLSSQDYDALLMIRSPNTATPGTESVLALVDALKHHPRDKYVTVLTNWCGESSSQEAQHLFSDVGLPTYRTSESTITAFMHIVKYRHNQRRLRETPVLPDSLTTNTSETHALLQQAIDDGVTTPDTHEASPVLRTYSVHTLPTWITADSTETVHIAEQIGYPVAPKLRSPDILHRSEIRGAILYLRTAAEVQQVADAMIDHIRLAWPQARIHDLLVQSVVNRADAQELRVVVGHDPVFGPLIMLDGGGVEWRAEDQTTVALPPLSMDLARYLVIRAIKNKRIRGRSALHPLDIAGLSQLLIQVPNLIVGCPEVQRLDIHPLFASDNEFTALDVMPGLVPFGGDSENCLAIRPYPYQQGEWIVMKNGDHCLFRPILPEDEPQLLAFIAQVTKEGLYYHYFSEINESAHGDLANMIQIDCDREMAFVAARTTVEKSEILGVTRTISGPNNIGAESAVLVRSGLKGLGLERRLLERLIACTQSHGLQRPNGITMPNNRGVIGLTRELEFTADIQLEDGIVSLSLPLNQG